VSKPSLWIMGCRGWPGYSIDLAAQQAL